MTSIVDFSCNPPVPVHNPVQMLDAAEVLVVVFDAREDRNRLVTPRGQVGLAPELPRPRLAASERPEYLQLTPRFSSQIHDLTKIFSGIKTI